MAGGLLELVIARSRQSRKLFGIPAKPNLYCQIKAVSPGPRSTARLSAVHSSQLDRFEHLHLRTVSIAKTVPVY